MKTYRTAFGDTMSWIIGDAETNGAYSIHHRVAPPGARSSAHVHSRLTEAFYVLSGDFEFVVGGETIAGKPGVFAQATPGVEHAWRVVGEDPGLALVIFTPSARKAFFEELDTLVAAGPPVDTKALLALSEKYGWT